MKEKTFDELEPGDLLKYYLVFDKTYNDEFFTLNDGKSITLLDLEDPYYGPVHRGVKEDEKFELLYEKGSKEYTSEINKLIAGRRKYIVDARKDIQLIKSFLKE